MAASGASRAPLPLPDYELKRSEIAFANSQCGAEQCLALFAGSLGTAGQYQCMAKHHDAFEFQ